MLDNCINDLKKDSDSNIILKPGRLQGIIESYEKFMNSNIKFNNNQIIAYENGCTL